MGDRQRKKERRKIFVLAKRKRGARFPKKKGKNTATKGANRRGWEPVLGKRGTQDHNMLKDNNNN